MRNKAIGALLVAAGTIGVTLPALASGGATAASTHTVVLKNIRFHPATLSIKRGDSVAWVWRDGGEEHNVTGKGFHSRTQTHGSFSVRFTRAGTYNYRCTLHEAEGMKGKVLVH